MPIELRQGKNLYDRFLAAGLFSTFNIRFFSKQRNRALRYLDRLFDDWYGRFNGNTFYPFAWFLRNRNISILLEHSFVNKGGFAYLENKTGINSFIAIK